MNQETGLLDRLNAARMLMEQDCHRPLSVAQIADRAGCSPFYFIRAFRRVFGLTPHQYLTRLRIDRARALLTYSELSLTDICFAVGYSSVGSFSTLFRRRAACSPSQYRRRTRTQNREFYRAVPA